MKKMIVCSVLLFALLFSAAGCTPEQSEQKFVGSRNTPNIFFEMEPYQTVAAIKEDSDAVVIAHYSEAPKEWKEEAAGMELHSSRYMLHVDTVLQGDIKENSNIVFSQVGKPDSDEYETKLKKGKQYLLFLCKKETAGEAVYDAAGMEQGIVEIKNNQKLYSYTDIGAMAALDGKDFAVLQQELVK